MRYAARAKPSVSLSLPMLHGTPQKPGDTGVVSMCDMCPDDIGQHTSVTRGVSALLCLTDVNGVKCQN